MKIKNIFKKAKKEVTISKVENLNKKELEKVSGGATEWWGHCNEWTGSTTTTTVKK